MASRYLSAVRARNLSISRAAPPVRTNNVTLVAVTAWGREEHRRQSRDAGVDLYLTTPVDAAQVLALVDECPVR